MLKVPMQPLPVDPNEALDAGRGAVKPPGRPSHPDVAGQRPHLLWRRQFGKKISDVAREVFAAKLCAECRQRSERILIDMFEHRPLEDRLCPMRTDAQVLADLLLYSLCER